MIIPRFEFYYRVIVGYKTVNHDPCYVALAHIYLSIFISLFLDGLVFLPSTASIMFYSDQLTLLRLIFVALYVYCKSMCVCVVCSSP